MNKELVINQTPSSRAEIKSDAKAATSATAPATVPATVKSGLVLKSKSKVAQKTTPSVYDYTNFREFLQAFIQSKKSANSAYSASAFVRKAGLGVNSRGYLKLVVDGKRNLTSQTIRSFSEACELDSKKSIYFENLVYFNQSDKPQDRKYYFERLVASTDRTDHKPLQILESQWRLFNHWYITAIRELVAIDGFREDSHWISKMLKSKITQAEARQALQDLLNVGLLQRDPTNGKLIQAEPIIRIAGGVFNPFIHNFHLGMIERAKDALTEDHYQERHASGVTLSVPISVLPNLIDEVRTFRSTLTEKYGVAGEVADSVVQVNVQLFQLTNPKFLNKKKETSK